MAMSILMAGASVGAPALTANRAGTPFWVLVSLGLLNPDGWVTTWTP